MRLTTQTVSTKGSTDQRAGMLVYSGKGSLQEEVMLELRSKDEQGDAVKRSGK